MIRHRKHTLRSLQIKEPQYWINCVKRLFILVKESPSFFYINFYLFPVSITRKIFLGFEIFTRAQEVHIKIAMELVGLVSEYLHGRRELWEALSTQGLTISILRNFRYWLKWKYVCHLPRKLLVGPSSCTWMFMVPAGKSMRWWW